MAKQYDIVMTDAFISYRRKPSASLAHLLQKELQAQYRLDIYLDTTRTDSAKVQFPERLLGAIDTSKVFICLLADSTLESEWVLREIERAYQQQKPCIPVFQESYSPLSIESPAIDYVLNFDGVHVLDERGLFMDEAVQQIAGIVKRTIPQRQVRKGLFLFLLVLLMPAIAVAIFVLARPANDTPDTIAQVQTDTLTEKAAPTDEPTFTPALTDEPIATPTVMPTPTSTASPTDPINGSSLSPEQIALMPVAANADWIPYERDFNGVTMVLVPAGCFMMGSNNGDGDEIPVNMQCFDNPFWIGKTEVTLSLYTSSSPQDDAPVQSLSWLAARDFCEAKGMHLPTEAEWEYAARGPDNLRYPWGNEFVTENVVFADNSDGLPSVVGSRPSGVSWVGALDMSGNVWEWVSSVYEPYPYDSQDGREYTIGNDFFQITNSQRALRGGSALSARPILRAANRTGLTARSLGFEDDYVGFRCARSYEP